jgi:hypothetical protein
MLEKRNGIRSISLLEISRLEDQYELKENENTTNNCCNRRGG